MNYLLRSGLYFRHRIPEREQKTGENREFTSKDELTLLASNDIFKKKLVWEQGGCEGGTEREE